MNSASGKGEKRVGGCGGQVWAEKLQIVSSAAGGVGLDEQSREEVKRNSEGASTLHAFISTLNANE